MLYCIELNCSFMNEGCSQTTLAAKAEIVMNGAVSKELTRAVTKYELIHPPELTPS